jgi:hypothetical protein
VRLILSHPHVAARSCEDCKKWYYEDSPTRMALEVFTRGKDEEGRPLRVERIAGQEPRCAWCPKVPRDVVDPCPEAAVELSEKNWRAYQHYLECRAVGEWPTGDAIVRRNAMLIRGVEESAARAEAAATGGGLRSMLLGLVSGGKK